MASVYLSTFTGTPLTLTLTKDNLKSGAYVAVGNITANHHIVLPSKDDLLTVLKHERSVRLTVKTGTISTTGPEHLYVRWATVGDYTNRTPLETLTVTLSSVDYSAISLPASKLHQLLIAREGDQLFIHRLDD